MTLIELIRSTTDYFAKRGIESPRLNSEHLVAHALGCKRLDLYMMFDRELGEAELAPLRDQVRQRGAGVPLQHLLGTAEFHGRLFNSDARALVPRPETEQLVEEVLKRASSHNGNSIRLLDVGTGTGVIAITLALELPHATVEAVDISPDALALACENAERLGAADRVAFRQADLLEGATGAYTCIVANLPYIASSVLPTLSREVQHDPRLALDGGTDGLDLIRKLILQAKEHLTGGTLALEIGDDQADDVSAFLTKENYRDMDVASDYGGCRRFVFAQHG
jgi:release factor glutamine methyltransferase